MADYNSSYTGPQIDNAVGAGLALRGVDGMVKSDGNGNISAAVAGVDYQAPGGGGGDVSLIGRASGSVVNFTDPVGGQSLKSFVVDIVPAQAGSGDPSPSNIRAISGWTQADIVCEGNNLFVDLEDGYYGGSGQISAASATQQEKLTDAYVELGDNTSITFSIQTASASTQWAAVVYYDKNKTFLSRVTYTSSGSVTTAENVFSSFPTGAYYARFCARTYGSSDVRFLFKSAATMAFGQTVYGGQLDVNTGKLTVTHAAITFTGTGTESWTLSNSRFQTSVSGMAAAESYGDPWVKCNAFEAISFADRSTKQGVVVGYTGAAYLYFYVLTLLSISTVDQWKAWLAQNPVTVVYPLATPTVVQLTAAEITTVLGENHVSVNCGEVSVEYWRNPVLRDEIQAMIDAAVLGAIGGSY